MIEYYYGAAAIKEANSLEENSQSLSNNFT
jgi:hypothetical protein